jgi:hypothetical protein
MLTELCMAKSLPVYSVTAYIFRTCLLVAVDRATYLHDFLDRHAHMDCPDPEMTSNL